MAPDVQASLWRLHVSWWPELDEQERLAALLDEHGHWRLYLDSRHGDEQAARRFERHWRQVVRRSLGRGFTHHQVEELASVFFERVYRKGMQFAWSSPFTVYLQTVLLNITRDELRRWKRFARTRPEITLDKAADVPSPERSAEDLALEGERREAVHDALARLTPGDRLIVRRCLLEEQAGQELARELGMTRDALYKRLSRARRKVKALLSSDPRLSTT